MERTTIYSFFFVQVLNIFCIFINYAMNSAAETLPEVDGCHLHKPKSKNEKKRKKE